MYWRPDAGSVASPGSTLVPLQEADGWTTAGLVGCTSVAHAAASMLAPLATIASATAIVHTRVGRPGTLAAYFARVLLRPSPTRCQVAQSREI
jgi:hypothetical protein